MGSCSDVVVVLLASDAVSCTYRLHSPLNRRLRWTRETRYGSEYHVCKVPRGRAVASWKQPAERDILILVVIHYSITTYLRATSVNIDLTSTGPLKRNPSPYGAPTTPDYGRDRRKIAQFAQRFVPGPYFGRSQWMWLLQARAIKSAPSPAFRFSTFPHPLHRLLRRAIRPSRCSSSAASKVCPSSHAPGRLGGTGPSCYKSHVQMTSQYPLNIRLTCFSLRRPPRLFNPTQPLPWFTLKEEPLT